MPRPSPCARPASIALCLGLLACNAEVGPAPTVDAGAVADAGVAPTDAGAIDAGHPEDLIVSVPADLPRADLAQTCVALDPGERVLGVSPEGHLWVAATSSVSAAVRVFDGWDPAYEGRYALPVGDLRRVQAWTATAASFVAEGQLFHAVDGLRTLVSIEATLAADATLCGDPTGRAFVYSDGALYEREEDTWLQWTGVEAALQPDARLLARDGECSGPDDGVWFASGDLELWQLHATELRRPAALDGATQPSLLGDAVLALAGAHLFVGPDWTEYRFEGGDASQLAAAGDYAWLKVGDGLLRFDGERFEAVGTSTDARGLYPHAAGGLWIAGAGRACHLAPAGMLRVEGIRSGARSKASGFSLRARASEPGLAVTASLDGEALAARATRDGWFVFSGPLDIGWHTVTLGTDGAEVTRKLSVKRIPTVERGFAVDVQPIFDTHCAACHVAGNAFNAPDLSTLSAWRDRAAKIRERVIEAGDMPPVATRDPSWDEEEITVINEWLSGGLRP